MLSIITLGDSKITIGVRRSKRSKRIRLVSSLNGIEAVVPIDFRAEELERFVSSKRDWIIKTSRHYAKLKERYGVPEPGTIYFLGSKYRYRVIRDRNLSAVVSETMKLITFHVTDMRKQNQQIQEWYREQTGKIISERLPALAVKLGLRYNKVSVKSQRSRWASCSRKGNLNFNLLLAAAPLEVIDYVIIHELTHLIQLDHSARFWQLVKDADPHYEKHREWLTNYAPVIKI
ncbi:MAG TPA: SprT family zinc-dependent metalloprotease [Nitrososphaera sp.]|nr:SprT family zinc-dependent metalloprotease [Nitrososphaera sp.]